MCSSDLSRRRRAYPDSGKVGGPFFQLRPHLLLAGGGFGKFGLPGRAVEERAHLPGGELFHVVGKHFDADQKGAESRQQFEYGGSDVVSTHLVPLSLSVIARDGAAPYRVRPHRHAVCHTA